jgi:hypothetical protein
MTTASRCDVILAFIASVNQPKSYATMVAIIGGDRARDVSLDRGWQMNERQDNPHGSIGAFRVRELFNPSGNELVDKIKRYTADLIDLCEGLKPLDARCAALAQTSYEEACMWATKAATAQK